MRSLVLTLVSLTGCFSEPDGNECTPGEFECMCTNAGECLGELECRGGVCLDPLPDETDSMTTSVPTTGDSSTSSTTMPSSPSTTTSEGSSSSGDGSTTRTTDATAAETAQVECDTCLLEAINGNCPECTGDPSCQDIHDCIFLEGGTVEGCCVDYPTGIEPWNNYVMCAMQTEACMGQCDWTCEP